VAAWAVTHHLSAPAQWAGTPSGFPNSAVQAALTSMVAVHVAGW